MPSTVPFPVFDMAQIQMDLAQYKANNHFIDVAEVEQQTSSLSVKQTLSQDEVAPKPKKRQFTFSDVKADSSSTEYYAAKNHENTRAHNRTKTFSAVCMILYMQVNSSSLFSTKSYPLSLC